VGGYFNQGYYPSKNNMFIPAQSVENQVDVPVFRLLGSDPIYNYDYGKFASEGCKKGPYTMEPAYNKTSGGNPDIVDWYLESYFKTESLGFAYMQIGQENSFAMFDLITPLRMQIEKILKLDDVKIEKMCDTGKAFKAKYPDTPATSVCSLRNWDTTDCQSVYYDSKYYTANVMRVDNKVFIRALYLFDDRIKDYYENVLCDTFDAVYESLPIVDTAYQKGDTDGGFGIILDDNGTKIDAKKTADEELTVFWGDKSVVFKKDCVLINNCKPTFTYYMNKTDISIDKSTILYNYKDFNYKLNTKGCDLKKEDNTIIFIGDEITLTPEKI
jgi:hypothetical protein